MNKTKLLLIGITASISFTSCKKLSSCIETENEKAKLGQEITLINCSENYEDAKLDLDDGSRKKSMDETYTTTYHEVGTYTAVLTTEKKQKSEESSVKITIEAPTKEEIVANWKFSKFSVVTFGFTSNYNYEYYNDFHYYSDGIASENITFNSDGTCTDGDWSLDNLGNITIDGAEYSIYKLYEDELVLKFSDQTYYTDDYYDLIYLTKN